MSEAFKPEKHLRELRGRGGTADYLDVKWRIVWLRHEHPDAIIETEKIAGGMESNYAEFRARVSIPGKGSATGHGSETKADFGDFIEKAETKAIGRAIAALGYGTQFVGNELDEGERIADAPVERKQPRTQPAPAAPAGNGTHPLLDTIKDDQADPKKRETALHNYFMSATTVLGLGECAALVEHSGMPQATLDRAYNWHADRIVKAQPASHAG